MFSRTPWTVKFSTAPTVTAIASTQRLDLTRTGAANGAMGITSYVLLASQAESSRKRVCCANAIIGRTERSLPWLRPHLPEEIDKSFASGIAWVPLGMSDGCCRTVRAVRYRSTSCTMRITQPIQTWSRLCTILNFAPLFCNLGCQHRVSCRRVSLRTLLRSHEYAELFVW